MQKTKIEWCTMTWNPVTGCWHGCNYCYAKKIAERFGDTPCESGNCCYCADCREHLLGFRCQSYRPAEKIHTLENKRYWYVPRRRVRQFPYGFEPTFHTYRLDEPIMHKKPERIFVVSMGDLFGDWVPEGWITKVFDACIQAPQHKYMFLTKNPKRYTELAEKGLLPALDNFWYGQTCTKGQVKAFFGPYHQFLSAEPLQGVVDPWGFELVIVGTETGNRKGKYIPTIRNIMQSADNSMGCVFMKDSLVPIIGEKDMRREIPDELKLQWEEK